MDGGLRHECDGGCRRGQHDERDLLHVNAARGLAPPPEGPAKASERINVQDQQHDREAHRHRLGEKGTAEQGHGQPVPPSAVRPPLAGSQVRQDRRQEEQPREHIAPFGDPRDGFNAQGMDPEHEGGKPSGNSERVISFRWTGQSQGQDL